MNNIILDRISPDLAYKENWRSYLNSDKLPDEERFVLGADVFYEPDYNLVGVAYSWHLLHAHKLRERDIQFSFDKVRSELQHYDPATRTDCDFLKKLILEVSQGFAHSGIFTNDNESPWLCIALVRLQQNYLTVASIGGIDIYAFRNNRSGQIIESNRMNETTRWALTDDAINLSDINSREVTVNSDDLLIIATDSMREVIAGANLGDFSRTGACDPKSANRRLRDTLRIQSGRYDDPTKHDLPGAYTDYYIRGFGAAWAIVGV